MVWIQQLKGMVIRGKQPRKKTEEKQHRSQKTPNPKPASTGVAAIQRRDHLTGLHERHVIRQDPKAISPSTTVHHDDNDQL